MSTLSFSCPKCDKTYDKVKPEMVGHKVRCSCGFVFRLGSKEDKNPEVSKKLRDQQKAKRQAAREQEAEELAEKRRVAKRELQESRERAARKALAAKKARTEKLEAERIAAEKRALQKKKALQKQKNSTSTDGKNTVKKATTAPIAAGSDEVAKAVESFESIDDLIAVKDDDVADLMPRDELIPINEPIEEDHLEKIDTIPMAKIDPVPPESVISGDSVLETLDPLSSVAPAEPDEGLDLLEPISDDDGDDELVTLEPIEPMEELQPIDAQPVEMLSPLDQGPVSPFDDLDDSASAPLEQPQSFQSALPNLASTKAPGKKRRYDQPKRGVEKSDRLNSPAGAIGTLVVAVIGFPVLCFSSFFYGATILAGFGLINQDGVSGRAVIGLIASSLTTLTFIALIVASLIFGVFAIIEMSKGQRIRWPARLTGIIALLAFVGVAAVGLVGVMNVMAAYAQMKEMGLEPKDPVSYRIGYTMGLSLPNFIVPLAWIIIGFVRSRK